MDRIDDMNLFLRVIELGSISAAARSLDLPVAVASQRLKRLEKQFGVRLLHRTTRKLRLTDEGSALAERARPLIEEMDSLVATLRGTPGEVEGSLRVTIPASFGRQYISPLLPEFLARHPRVKMHLHLADQLIDLVGEAFDLAVRIGALRDSTLVARRLAVNQRVLCASPTYLRRCGSPRTPADLARHECLLLVTGNGTPELWRLRARNGRETTVRVHGRLQSNLGEVVRDAAIAGLGIALHSTWHVCEDLRAGRLKVVLPEYQLPDSGVYAVMPPGRAMLPRVRAFVDFLAERFGGTPPWERHRGRQAQ